MLSEHKFFQIFWQVALHLGLQPNKLTSRGKYRAIFYLLIFLIPNLILYVIKLFTIDTWDERLSGLETFPFLMTNILEGLNFAYKSKEIEKIFVKIDQLFKEIDTKDLLSRAIFIFTIYQIINIFVIILSISGENMLFWQTRDTPVLTYTPVKDGPGFLAIWILHVTFLVYTRTISFIADQFLIAMMILLSFYLKAFRNFLKTRKINELREVTDMHIEMKW